MNTENLIECFNKEKDYVEKKINESKCKETIKEILKDETHVLYNEVMNLNKIRTNIIKNNILYNKYTVHLKNNIPYLRDTLLPFIDSHIISTFNIPNEKILELVNDETGDKILATLDLLSPFELKLIELTTKVDLSFYNEIRI